MANSNTDAVVGKILRTFEGSEIVAVRPVSEQPQTYKAALAYIARGLRVLPIGSDKQPVFKSPHPEGSPERATCKGECGKLGHGVHDATTDEAQVREWFATGRYTNIGIALPEDVCVIDVDVRHGGDAIFEQWCAEHGTDWLDGVPHQKTGGERDQEPGDHFWFKRPADVMLKHPTETKNENGKPLHPIECLRVGKYVVAAPSVTAHEYCWQLRLPHDLVALRDMPPWLVDLCTIDVEAIEHSITTSFTRSSGVDELDEAAHRYTSWRQLLERYGWTCKRAGDGASDGTKWRHPEADPHHKHSATMRYDCLFVYSPNTPFPQTSTGDTHGVTLFSAISMLEHGGDDKETAAALRADGFLRPLQHKWTTVDSIAFMSGNVPSDTPGVTLKPSSWPKLDDAALYGLGGDVVRTLAPHTEADPTALLVTFETAFGNAVGSAPHFRVGAGVHSACEFAALVGRSAKGRKGTADDEVNGKRGVMAWADAGWNRDRRFGGIGSGEGLIAAVQDEYEEDADGNMIVKPTDKRAFFVEPEFARVLAVAARDGSTVSAIVRQAWDSGDLRVMTRQHPLVARGAHISLIAHITEHELAEKLTSTDAVNGFANRFTFHCVERPHLRPLGGDLVDKDYEKLGAEVRARLVAARKVSEMKRSPEADELWSELYTMINVRSVDGMLDAVVARLDAHLLRWSMLFALTDASNVIEPRHIEAAWAVVCHADESAVYLFGDKRGDPIADTLLEALRALPAGTGLDRTAQSALFSRHVKAEQLDRAHADLVRQGLVRIETEVTGGRGRPRIVTYAVEVAEHERQILRLIRTSQDSTRTPK